MILGAGRGKGASALSWHLLCKTKQGLDTIRKHLAEDLKEARLKTFKGTLGKATGAQAMPRIWKVATVLDAEG